MNEQNPKPPEEPEVLPEPAGSEETEGDQAKEPERIAIDVPEPEVPADDKAESA